MKDSRRWPFCQGDQTHLLLICEYISKGKFRCPNSPHVRYKITQILEETKSPIRFVCGGFAASGPTFGICLQVHRFSRITIGQFVSQLGVGQLWSVVIVIVALLRGSFSLGYTLSSSTAGTLRKDNFWEDIRA